jgi:hypothetical protein
MVMVGYCRKCGITFMTNATLKPILVTTDIEGAEPYETMPGQIFVIRCKCGRLVDLVLPKKRGK